MENKNNPRQTTAMAFLMRTAVLGGLGLGLLAIGAGILLTSYAALMHPAAYGGGSKCPAVNAQRTDASTTGNCETRQVDWFGVGGLFFGGLVAVLLGWSLVRRSLSL